MKYCPQCGAEYRAGYEECSDCRVPLVDDLPKVRLPEHSMPEVQERVVVFRTGRRMDAELVRARLEADGLDVRVWSGGLGVWRLESAMTEITGIPNDFNSHQVMVLGDDLERAQEILAEHKEEDEPPIATEPESPRHFMSMFRKRWLLVGFFGAWLLLYAMGFGSAISQILDRLFS